VLHLPLTPQQQILRYIRGAFLPVDVRRVDLPGTVAQNKITISSIGTLPISGALRPRMRVGTIDAHIGDRQIVDLMISFNFWIDIKLC